MHIDDHPSPEKQFAQLGRNHWSVARLISLTKGLEVIEAPIDCINVYHEYKEVTLREMVTHIKAVNNADLSYPIILDEDGEILDGRHRLMKAMMVGAKTIKVVRFDVNPVPCRCDD